MMFPTATLHDVMTPFLARTMMQGKFRTMLGELRWQVRLFVLGSGRCMILSRGLVSLMLTFLTKHRCSGSNTSYVDLEEDMDLQDAFQALRYCAEERADKDDTQTGH